ncbi:MAG: helix-turn-helix domain-containing protein [Clostridia bacterium]|nr:helix-turn-helix domain-containing protein [Clostridia bacterium]
MFFITVGSDIPEISHKCMPSPDKSVYFNHIHHHCEILLFISGHADYSIDGELFRPSPYDLLFIPSGTYHYLIPTSHDPYENYVIGIDPDRLSQVAYGKLFSPPYMLSIRDAQDIREFFVRLDTYHARYDAEDFLRMATLVIEELITHLCYRKEELRSVRSRNNAYIDRIVRYIAEHLEQELDARRIAQAFHLSCSYVQNLFSEHMHIGLKSYIRQKKLFAARGELLRGVSAREVCERYAFGDYSSFYRLYKKTYGVSPKDAK